MKNILFLIFLILGCCNSTRRLQYGPYQSTHAETGVPKSGCDPDYGWWDGVDGSKCYMILRDYDSTSCYFNTGDYNYGMTWFEAWSCCYANHGYMAEPVNKEEHEHIKNRLIMVDGQGSNNSYWLGGADIYNEGEWRWNTGQVFSFAQWQEGEPNNDGNEDCVAMTSWVGYDWWDVNCNTGAEGEAPFHVVCEKLVS